MLGRSYEGQNCSAARALEVAGERWSLLIIRDALFRGMTRFTDFQRSLRLAPNILATRLDGFVRDGLMEQRPQPGRPGQPEYVLTDKGRDLAPAIIALTAWGDRWAAPQGPPVIFQHQACGGEITQQTACRDCGEPVPADTVTTRPGPEAQHR
ncbi:MAG: helix-turn-helix domain-containing protein [Streptosporangiaceae bacterium]|jgi:DNA-binding HxlR family transcriptional regulator